MKNNFTFNLTTRIEFGNGYVNKVGSLAIELNAKKVMLVTDKGIMSTPIADKVINNLKREGLSVLIFDGVRPNPRDSDCQEGGDLAIKNNIDTVVALGGGSSMDTAKAVAGLITNPGAIHDIMKPNKLKNDMAPLICIPTTAGTGSEVTSFAVITLEDEKRKSSIFDDKIRPNVAINDPELLREVPDHIAAATGMDALTHAIEAYTCKIATPITDGMALHSIRCIANSLTNMVHNRDEKSCYDMMMGSLLAGIAFGFSDIAAVHCLAEALGGLYDTPHGVANSIFLPIVFEYNIASDIRKHKEVAMALGINPEGKSDRETAQAAVWWLKQLSKDLQIPLLKELGYVKTEDFGLLAKNCMKNVSLPSNPRKFTEKTFEEMYWKAFTLE